MNILAFAGFLGSGKTTVIKNCINTMLKQGLKIAIIENEIGTTSIDDKILNEGGIEITTLTNGCVCCSISGSLISAANQIEREINPDWLIVELTGLAYMTGIRNLFAERGKQYKLYSVTIIDIARWMKLLKVTRPLLTDQVSGANVIVINKTDITEPTAEEMEEISKISGGSPVIKASAQNDGGRLWDDIRAHIMKAEQGGEEHMEMFSEEHCHDHDEHTCNDPNCTVHHHQHEHDAHVCNDPNCTVHHHHHEHDAHTCDDPNCTLHHHNHEHDEHVCNDPNCTVHHHHHEHDAHTCDDPSCTLHHHHHEHDEHTCDDPSCTLHHHHHDAHEELIEDSLVMSLTRSFSPNPPETTASLREKGEKTLLHLGELVAFEGVVAGHIKGVITTDGGGIAFSLTRIGVVDVTELGGWKSLDKVEAYTMTINIMSLVQAEITEDDFFALMA